MNVFYLDRNPITAAQMHCDKHVVKMILEYAQLLSTAHRLLDGTPATWFWTDTRLVGDRMVTKTHRKVHYAMDGEVVEIVDEPLLPEELQREANVFEDRKVLVVRNSHYFLASHMKHPAAIWCRTNAQQYGWLFQLFAACLEEYTHRYGKQHSAHRLRPYLARLPKNISFGEYVDPPMSMDDAYKDQDVVMAYQNYYVGAKTRFARWTNRPAPDWFIARTENYDAAHFCRTRDMAAATA